MYGGDFVRVRRGELFGVKGLNVSCFSEEGFIHGEEGGVFGVGGGDFIHV
jgi:hypothetical protein